MSDSFKKEWEKTEIPESVYARARNRAWARLHERRTPRNAGWIWAAGAAALLLGLTIGPLRDRLIHRGPEVAGIEQTRPIVPEALQPTVSRAPAVKPAETIDQREVAARRSGKSTAGTTRGQTRKDSDRLERVVMNFVLPESGVQMIWIVDKKFVFNGGRQ